MRRSKISVFIFLVLLISIFLYILRLFKQIKPLRRPAISKSVPTITPSLTIVVKKAIRDVKVSNSLEGVVRYLTSSYDLNQNTKEYESNVHVITYDLEKKVEVSRITKNWIFPALSPSGKYLSGSTETDTKKNTYCDLHVLNLESSKTVNERYDRSCGGPFAPAVGVWSDGERYASFSTMSHKIVDLDLMKVVADYPPEGVSRGGTPSSDKLYLAYDIADNFFSFEGTYGSFGILKIDGIKSGSIKVFKMNRNNGNDFICWHGHEAIFVRRYYDNSKINSPDLNSEAVDLSIYSYDIDKDKLTQLCHGMSCEGKESDMCEKNAISPTPTSASIKDTLTRLSNEYDLTIREPKMNSSEDLLLFSAKKTSLTGSNDTDHYDSSVYVANLKSNILYKLGYGEDVRWVAGVEPHESKNSSGFVDCRKIGEYVSRDYNVSFVCPQGWSMIKSSSSEFNFINTGDNVPAESGFSLVVDNNATGETLAGWCNSHSTELSPEGPSGYLCPSGKRVEASVVKINGHDWEKVQNNQIGVPPYGYVNYNSYNKGLFFTVPNYSADTAVVDRFVSSIKFIGK